MSFLEGFDPDSRSELQRAAREILLQPGEFLVLRGDPGGALFLVESGTLEVRDRRSIPEVVLTTMQPGTLLGEVAFVDGAPRSADVMAVGPARVLKWTRRELDRLMSGHPAIGARVFQAIAERAVTTIRQLTDVRVGQHIRQIDSAESADLDGWVERVAERFKRGVAPLETQLRETSADAATADQVRHQLDALQTDVAALFSSLPRDPVAQQAAERLRRELHPFLVRSSLADRCLHRKPGPSGAEEVAELVHRETPSGEGNLGRILDAWLLGRPTFRAVRAMRGAVDDVITEALAQRDAPRALFVGSHPDLLARRPSEGASTPMFTVLDPLAATPPGDRTTLRDSVIDFTNGRVKAELWPQHVVVVHGLLEFLPTPLAVSLLQRCRDTLPDDGVIVLSALLESDDDPILHRLLDWPSIRRTSDGVRDLIRAAGLRVVSDAAVDPPGCVLCAGRREVAPTVASE